MDKTLQIGRMTIITGPFVRKARQAAQDVMRRLEDGEQISLVSLDKVTAMGIKEAIQLGTVAKDEEGFLVLIQQKSTDEP